MRKLSCAWLAACLLARVATAEWQQVSSNTESGATAGIEHRHVVVRETESGADATLDLALFPAKAATLRIVDNAKASANLAEAMARENCVAGVNGGYFDTSFRPLGLRVIDGAVTSPLTRAHLLTGVLCASSRRVEIVRVAEFSRRGKLNAAVECGPFLVDSGLRVSSLDDRRSARRSFAATSRGGKAALGVSSDLTLAQLSQVLSDLSLANESQTWRAINLDGGSSSAFWFRRSDGSAFSISEDKSVRDFVGVSSR